MDFLGFVWSWSFFFFSFLHRYLVSPSSFGLANLASLVNRVAV